jgi:hypothetical protein
MRRIRSNHAAITLPTLRLEGGLFLPDQLEKAALGRASWQSEADYRTPKGLSLKDDYSRAFQIAGAQWRQFSASFERSDLDATGVTKDFLLELLRDVFGYTSVLAVDGITHDGRCYPVSLLAADVPIIVAPHTLGLDDTDPRFAVTGGGSRKKSPFQAGQELLNASPRYLWALVSNGRQVRLLRDAATLTRPSYLEIDLEDLLGASRFSEFANAWRLIHASRADKSVTGDTARNVWEGWREAGQEEGTRVRDGLRHGVTQALITLGNGFLQHPANDDLRQQLHDGRLDADGYFQQLLRLIYRLLFLFNVEERGVLHVTGDTTEALAARRAYAEGYAVGRLRELSLKRRARNRFDDNWQALRIVFKGLAQGEPKLSLPALGGLFAETQCFALNASAIDNAHLLTAMQHLRWTSHDGALAPVDYRNMGPEELGSVYESLLELVPEVDLTARQFGFIGLTSEASTAGNTRKLTGSYYTPDSLVQELIRSALNPVIEQRIAAHPANPIEAILSIRVIDPACGSGHFLLAAARRLAETLAQFRVPDGAVKPQDYRHALREVVGRCIFGVDRNPMAVELARTALWLEGFEEGRPLSFLDHHLRCGDALMGLLDLKVIEKGIPQEAFKALSGDDKDVCKTLAKANTAGLKRLARDLKGGQSVLRFDQLPGLEKLQSIEAMPTDSPADVARKEIEYLRFLEEAGESRLAQAADLLVGAFLLPKGTDKEEEIPTSELLHRVVMGDTFKGAVEAKARGQIQAARSACVEARVFHWPLVFPQVFATGGFDCVLGNPPWEMLQLDPQEFFATRDPAVANAQHMAARDRMITDLEQSNARLFRSYWSAVRQTEAAQNFIHASGRFPASGFGRLNLAYLFTELFLDSRKLDGRGGLIVPTGIATDSFSQHLFNRIAGGNLVSLYDLENRDGLFDAVDSRMKFCLLTLGSAQQAEFVCFATQVYQLSDSRRRFRLAPHDFRLLNPNTGSFPVFRSNADAELTKKIYSNTPVLLKEESEGEAESNPWGIHFMLMFMMNTDSYRFSDRLADGRVPLYEAKFIHQFDHRWATYTSDGDGRDVTPEQKRNPNFNVTPRYWVDPSEVEERLRAKGWTRGWLMGWRDICRATDERTVIASVVPRVGVGNQLPLMLFDDCANSQLFAALLANLSALTLDFVARHKTGGTHMNFFIYKQLPVLPPHRFSDDDLAFIVPRVLELTYTAHDLAPWAQELGYDGAPFVFDADRRALLRAELDAYYARLYGLSRDEMRYILDPADVLGEDYPSETFRVLKNKELSALGEYRTRRLVLEAWDRLEEGEWR